MFKNIEKPKKEKAQEKKEPIFATTEELDKKKNILNKLKLMEKDEFVEDLEKQRELLISLRKLARERIERISEEKEEEIYNEKEGIFTNIRFKETIDKKTNETVYISRKRGRPFVVLDNPSGLNVEPGKPYKAEVINKRPDKLFVMINE